MHRILLRRVLVSIPLLAFVSVCSFYVLRLAPGDPVRAYLGTTYEQADPAVIQQLRQNLGLDKPIHVQYFHWLRNAAAGNLGNSLLTQRPVAVMIAETLPNTLLLMVVAMALGIFLGITLGIVSGLRPNSAFDTLLSPLAYAGYAIPNFLLGMLLIYFVGVRLNWLPTQGMFSIGQSRDPALDRLSHLVLPVATLAFHDIVVWMRYQRNSLLEVLGEDYIRTARAKGLPERQTVFRHAWRNSLVSLITLLGYSLPRLVYGSYIVETIFAWPGMGRLSVTAAYQRDYPVIMGILLITAAIVIMGNLVADVCYGIVDPRVRREA